MIENKIEKIFSNKKDYEAYINIAESALADFLKLKPNEKVLIIVEESTNEDSLKIIQKAVEKIGSECEIFKVNEHSEREEIKKILSKTQLIIKLAGSGYKALSGIFDEDLSDTGNRLLCFGDIDPDIFQPEGAMTESLDDLEYRLNKMEEVLSQAYGFKISTKYGTNLDVQLRPFKERKWYKDSGVIDTPGKWDNLPGGEIFTTPDERNVSGVLFLPVLDSGISQNQGVDEFVKLTIKDGIITLVQGGKSAEILRERLKEDAQTEMNNNANPLNVYRIAEIAFGANSKARSQALDLNKPFDFTGATTVESEKRLGTIHLAFGSSKHGEQGTEGFEDSESHYDFVIPRNGLTIEMFTNEKDYRSKKNGRKLISEGGINFF